MPLILRRPLFSRAVLLVACAIGFGACASSSESGKTASGGGWSLGGANAGGSSGSSGTTALGGGDSARGGSGSGGFLNSSGGTTFTGGAGAGGTPSNGGARTVTTGGQSAGGSSFGGQWTAGSANGGSPATDGSLGSSSGGSAAGANSLGGKPGTVTAAPGATLVKPNLTAKRQKFEGWGTSLCWWANRVGGWPAQKLDAFLDMVVNPTTGLGYNVFRYNIGGGENPAHKHMGAYKDMPSFQPKQGTWNWNADARQVAVLSRLVATGENVIVEAFSNSPPYWMTKSGCASGSNDGSNNLKDDAYDAFASYLTDVVKHFRDELGITFRTLEPMNEPNANWWKSNGTQEGSHFSASNQQRIIKAVGAQLAAKGLSETRVSASDENSMDDAYAIMSGYDSTTLGYIAQMNTHSYAGSRRTQLRSLAMSKGKRLWQSESGPLSVTLADNTDAAIFMAGRIITDLRDLAPEAWVDWQLLDAATAWTSFSVNDAQQTAAPVKRFYMHAGFSRFIRPGATFIDIDNGEMVAALSSDSSTLTIVVRNTETATKTFTFDLTSLASVGTRVVAYRTSASEDLVQLPPITLQNWSFTASSPSKSVTTYVIPLAQ